MGKFVFAFTNIKIIYRQLINFFSDQTINLFLKNYKEAKIFLFLYAFFKLKPSLYFSEKKDLSLNIDYQIKKFKTGKSNIFYQEKSLILEIVINYLIFFKYKIIFSNNIFFKILIFPFFKLNLYFENKKVKKLVKSLNI